MDPIEQIQETQLRLLASRANSVKMVAPTDMRSNIMAALRALPSASLLPASPAKPTKKLLSSLLKSWKFWLLMAALVSSLLLTVARMSRHFFGKTRSGTTSSNATVPAIDPTTAPSSYQVIRLTLSPSSPNLLETVRPMLIHVPVGLEVELLQWVPPIPYATIELLEDLEFHSVLHPEAVRGVRRLKLPVEVDQKIAFVFRATSPGTKKMQVVLQDPAGAPLRTITVLIQFVASPSKSR